MKEKADTYRKICQTLLELHDAADSIFNVITTRVGLEHQRLHELSTRIQATQAKVEALSGTKRATKLYASAKYPKIPPDAIDFTPLFGGNGDGHRRELPAATLCLNLGHGKLDEEEGTLELFRFFSETNHEYWPREHRPSEGIGSVPSGTKSVADVMLFNTTELPYHRYRLVDNLAGAELPVGEEESKDKVAPLPAPPQSVLAGDAMPLSGGDEYGFRPTLGEVPSFSLPSTLPNLPMVAEISWSGSEHQLDSNPSIAPSAGHRRTGSFGGSSAVGTPTRSDTLSVDGSVRGFEEVVSPGPPFVHGATTVLPPLITPTAEAAIPSLGGADQAPGVDRKEKAIQPSSFSPPPPPSHTQPQKSLTPPPPAPIQKPVSLLPPPPPPPLPPTQKSLSPRPPPPPPPPPPRLQLSPIRPTLGNEGQTGQSSNPGAASPGNRQAEGGSPNLPPNDQQRAALLASIRSPGIKLRKTNTAPASPGPPVEQIVGTTKERSNGNRTQPVDVLAEMASTLKMRRLSMRGAGHDKGQAPVKLGQQATGVDDVETASVTSETNRLPIFMLTLPVRIKKQVMTMIGKNDCTPISVLRKEENPFL
ncbi:unnamed protein product [Sphagnum balticum]